jgi:thiol-disulfide isomerase/thioredoxin
MGLRGHERRPLVSWKSVFALLLLAAAGLGLAGCAAARGPLTAQNLLERSRGQVLVLLMGMEGCPNTQRGTEELAGYAAKRPAGVTIVRVDAPPPAEEPAPAPEWAHPYAYVLDARRELADRLEFFFYPTLYVLDWEGTVRYSGKLDLDDLRRMIGEIQAEGGGAKKIYTPALPPVGARGADFKAKKPDGSDVDLASVRGPKGVFLYFTSTTCPFSVRGLPAMAQLARRFDDKGIGFAVINKPETVENIGKVCAENAPGIPVIVDADATICRAYGVEPVPFFYLLDGKGAIAERKPFTPESALAALNRLLGLAPTSDKASGAG